MPAPGHITVDGSLVGFIRVGYEALDGSSLSGMSDYNIGSDMIRRQGLGPYGKGPTFRRGIGPGSHRNVQKGPTFRRGLTPRGKAPPAHPKHFTTDDVKKAVEGKPLEHYTTKDIKDAVEGGRPASKLTPGQIVAAEDLYRSAVERFRNSPLKDFKPRDAERFGIKTGSPEEWGKLAVALGIQESGLNPNAPHGGLYQFTQQDLRNYGVTGDVNDPNAQLEAMARQWERYIPASGAIAEPGGGPGSYSGYRGAAAYFEPFRYPESQLFPHMAEAAAAAAGHVAGPPVGITELPGMPHGVTRLPADPRYRPPDEGPPGGQAGGFLGRPQGAERSGMTAEQAGITPEFPTGGANWKDMDAELLARLNNAHRENPGAFNMVSGFRTYGQQKAIYDSGVRPAAPPGYSQHQAGLAADINDPSGWLHKNAAKFGLWNLPGDEPHFQLGPLGRSVIPPKPVAGASPIADRTMPKGWTEPNPRHADVPQDWKGALPMSSEEAMNVFSRQYSQLPQGMPAPEPFQAPTGMKFGETRPGVVSGRENLQRLPFDVNDFMVLNKRAPQTIKELNWYQNIERMRRADPERYHRLRDWIQKREQ